MDSRITQRATGKNTIFSLVSVAEQDGLCLTWSQTGQYFSRLGPCITFHLQTAWKIRIYHECERWIEKSGEDHRLHVMTNGDHEGVDISIPSSHE